MTVLSNALNPKSHLRGAVRPGLQALKKDHARNLLHESIKSRFTDSIDLDESLRGSAPGEHRWDYLIGDGTSLSVIAVEPHSAHSSEVSVVIEKRNAALTHLRPHLRTGARIAAWYWVSSGPVNFLRYEKTLLQLEQHGIKFVGRTLLPRHLPSQAPPSSKRPGPDKRGSGRHRRRR